MKRFAVVTRVPEEPDPGNLAIGGLHLWREVVRPFEKGWEDKGKYESFGKRIGPGILDMREPVFTLGELMVMDENERDVSHGRKPDKWDVDVEEFDNVEDAIRRAREVQGYD